MQWRWLKREIVLKGIERLTRIATELNLEIHTLARQDLEVECVYLKIKRKAIKHLR